MQINGVDIPEARIAEFCRRHGINRLSLFGSILGDDFRPESDIDVLAEFPSQAKVSLFDLGGMLMELREIFRRDVDLKTPGFLSERVRDGVLRGARVLYAA